MTVSMNVFWSDFIQSDSISLVVDESSHVVYGRSVVGGELECHFLEIKELANGTATSREKATLDFVHIAKYFDIGDVSNW